MIDARAANYACNRLDAFRAVHGESSRNARNQFQESVDLWLREGIGVDESAWTIIHERIKPDYEADMGAIMIGIVLGIYMCEYETDDG